METALLRITQSRYRSKELTVDVGVPAPKDMFMMSASAVPFAQSTAAMTPGIWVVTFVVPETNEPEYAAE